MTGVSRTDLLVLALTDASFAGAWANLALVRHAACRPIRGYDGLADTVLAGGARWAGVLRAARTRPLCAVAEVDSSLQRQQEVAGTCEIALHIEAYQCAHV